MHGTGIFLAMGLIAIAVFIYSRFIKPKLVTVSHIRLRNEVERIIRKYDNEIKNVTIDDYNVFIYTLVVELELHDGELIKFECNEKYMLFFDKLRSEKHMFTPSRLGSFLDKFIKEKQSVTNTEIAVC